MAGAAPCNRTEAPLVVCSGGRAGKTQILQLQMGAKRQALGGKHILSPPEHPRPLRFRHEWSQTVASTHPTTHTPHTHTHLAANTTQSQCHQHRGRGGTHCGRESLSSAAAPPNHKAISAAAMLRPLQDPPRVYRPDSLPFLFSSPLLTLR